MKWLIIERLKPPHHPRQCYVMACTDRHDGMFLGITVWGTETEPRGVEVGRVKETLHPPSLVGRPFGTPPPVVPDSPDPGFKARMARLMADLQQTTIEYSRMRKPSGCNCPVCMIGNHW